MFTQKNTSWRGRTSRGRRALAAMFAVGAAVVVGTAAHAEGPVTGDTCQQDGLTKLQRIDCYDQCLAQSSASHEKVPFIAWEFGAKGKTLPEDEREALREIWNSAPPEIAECVDILQGKILADINARITEGYPRKEAGSGVLPIDYYRTIAKLDILEGEMFEEGFESFFDEDDDLEAPDGSYTMSGSQPSFSSRAMSVPPGFSQNGSRGPRMYSLSGPFASIPGGNYGPGTGFARQAASRTSQSIHNHPFALSAALGVAGGIALWAGWRRREKPKKSAVLQAMERAGQMPPPGMKGQG